MANDRLLPRTALLAAALLACVMPLLPGCGSKASSIPDPCVDCAAEAGQLRVTNRAARACEVLVEATGGRVVSTEFGEGVVGKAIQEGDRSGLSLISKDANPLPEVAATIRFSGTLKLVQGACYGDTGDALAGDSIAL